MMRPVRFLGAIAMSLLSCTTAQAGMEEPYVQCVQQQLSAMGVSGVSVTGKINSATKAGIEAVRQRHPEAARLAALPRLSDYTAVSWCREMAALKPALRQMMPSSKPPHVLGKSKMHIALLQKSFAEVEQFFHSYYGIYPASRVDVAGAGSGATLADLAVDLQRLRGPSWGRMRNYVSEVCESPSVRFSGQAYLDQLLICWPYRKTYDAAWRQKSTKTISLIMVHEYMHHVQRELANDKLLRGGARTRSKRGPAWMVEGSAELAVYRWRQKRWGGSEEMLTNAMKYSGATQKGLGGMQNHGTVKGYEQYQIAMYAVYLLEERFGRQSTLDYWRAIGAGESWESAFRDTFGMSLRAYAGLFDDMRVKPVKAAAFRKGH